MSSDEKRDRRCLQAPIDLLHGSPQLMTELVFSGIFNFLKKGRGSSNFRIIRTIVLKLHTNILYPSRNFGIEFG